MTALQAAPVLASSPSYIISLRRWGFVHKYSSLICTLFMLLLCLTGIPLIFHHEIDTLLGGLPPMPTMPVAQDSARASVDDMVSNALKAAQQTRPELKTVQYIFIDKDDSRLAVVILNIATNAGPESSQTVLVDTRTAKLLAPPKPDEGFMAIMLSLHVDLFAGLSGTLFLGAMGLFLLIAIISGVVLYAPFMRKLNFAQVRTNKTKQIKWLDWHNLTGIVTMAWLSVVALTGVINTVGDPLLKYWQATQMTQLVAPFSMLPAVQKVANLDQAVQTAQAKLPTMRPFVIAMPGTPFSDKRHINVFMRGDTPVTSRLYQPVFLDGKTSQFAVTAPMPWYINGLFISQPLHFGDYGGMPLKIVWLLLDLIAIAVLLSGLYLWWKKRNAGEM